MNGEKAAFEFITDDKWYFFEFSKYVHKPVHRLTSQF